jgi:hypothetical protein
VPFASNFATVISRWIICTGVSSCFIVPPFRVMLNRLQHEMAHQLRYLDIVLLGEVVDAPLFLSGQPDAEHGFTLRTLLRQ